MNPADGYVEELIKSGELGQITRITATYDQDMLLDPEIPIAWRHKKDEGRDCGYRTVHLNPYHKGFSAFQPAGGIAIGFDDMKILQAKEILSVVTTGSEYACDFEMGAKVDETVDAVLASIESGLWEKV